MEETNCFQESRFFCLKVRRAFALRILKEDNFE